MFLGYVWPFLIYFVILFAVCYVVVEYGQNYFYDEVTPAVAAKVAFGAFLLAAILTITRSNFATMFTSDIGSTVLLAIAWAGVFILLYRFQPWHGFGLAMATLLIFAGMSTLAVDSMLSPRPVGADGRDQGLQARPPVGLRIAHADAARRRHSHPQPRRRSSLKRAGGKPPRGTWPIGRRPRSRAGGGSRDP